MRKHLIVSAIAIVSLSSVAVPASADGHGKDEGHTRRVRLLDNCDPATFDLAIRPGTCIPHGDDETVTFAEFLAKLNPTDLGHDEWENNPDEVDLKSGDQISVTVRGGEFHTFTEVPVTDGLQPGCIKELNEPLGLTGPAPTAAQCFGPTGFFKTTGVLPNGGSTLTVSGLSEGTHLFMCEIHPWMRTVVTVEGDHH